MTSDDLLDLLRDIGAREDGDIDLADTALVLAALDRPEASVADYRDHLAALAAATRSAATVANRADALAQAIFATHGYEGDTETYDDPENANLMSVIDRRKGLPVAIGILCIHAARAQGWAITGINFPSHFLLRLGNEIDGVIIDPFHGVAMMDDDDLAQRLTEMHGPNATLKRAFLRPVGNRNILLRLLNNIKLRALRGQDLERALAVVERMSLLAPGEDGLRMERALIQAESGQVKAAIKALEELRERGGGVESHALAGLLQYLKGRLN
jgi:regulator of sirC expression with transglutaminase-like and TPR domain